MEYLIMKEMGWSYRELLETPLEVVERIWRYMNTEAKFREREIRRGSRNA